ncbi:MAG: TonB family protein [Microcystaceae cyanobacterium]
MTSSVSPSPFKSSFNILNPTLLFITFSLGIHALVLWLVFPNFNPSSFSREGNETNDVALIELTEAERGLLPDLSAESFDVDDFNVPALGDLPPTSSSSIEFDPLALQSALPNLPPPPPSLPPLNYQRNIPITITPPSVTIPRRTYRPRTTYPNYRRFRSSIPSPPPNLPSPPSNLPRPPMSAYGRPNLNLPQQSNRPNFGQIREPIDPDALINRKIEPPALSGNQDNSPEIAATTPNQQQTPRLLSPEQRTAKQLQDDRMRRLVAETQQNARGLRYNDQNTTNEEAMNNNINWMAKVGTAQPKSRSLTGNYPRTACGRQLEGTAVYGVSVGPQGGITQAPYQIKSTGYGFLDQQALSQIQSLRFTNSSGQIQPYRVSVNFKYDSNLCGSRTAAPTQPAPNPVTPAPAVSPNPSQPKPAEQNKPNVIQSSPQPSQSPAPVTVEEVPSAKPQEETPNNQIIIEASPQPEPETLSPAPAAVEKPSVKPLPTEEAPQNPIETAPPPEGNQPPAPSAVRKEPAQPAVETVPQPEENKPPAPSAVRKAPPQPVQENQPSPPVVSPKPVEQSQPPAPAAVRKEPPKPVESQPPAPAAVRKAPSQPVENESPAPAAVEKPSESELSE